MQITRDKISPTTTKLTITAEDSELKEAKQQVIERLGPSVKVPGFRPGKAPVNLIEKQIDPSRLQTEFLEQIVNQLYIDAVQQQELRPAAPPAVEISKFVPFSTLEFTATVEVVGDIKVANYKKPTLKKPKVEITAEEVKNVLENLRQRGAKRQAATKPAKAGDEIIIDFIGEDAESKQPIRGADGKDYPLILGSQSFIPGFEDNLIGVKAGQQKKFDLTFPKDYAVSALQGKKVTFTVDVKQVQELALPKLDDDFAKTIGPFETLTKLKADIKKQLAQERQQAADREFENQLVQNIAEKSIVEIPAPLIDEEIERIEDEEKRSVVYRGQTWQEHLDEEGLSAEAHREKQRPAAELRIKAGLVLSEIAQAERITVSEEELEQRIQLLKGQYQDEAMQAELDKAENRRDIHSRLLTEKTIDKLRQYAEQ